MADRGPDLGANVDYGGQDNDGRKEKVAGGRRFEWKRSCDGKAGRRRAGLELDTKLFDRQAYRIGEEACPKTEGQSRCREC